MSEQVAWLCRWQTPEGPYQAVVWAWTIEAARLDARQWAGPSVAVAARLATHAEVAESDRTTDGRRADA